MADKNLHTQIYTTIAIKETSKKSNSNLMVTTQHDVTDDAMIEFYSSNEFVVSQNKCISDHIKGILHVPLYLSSAIGNKFEQLIQEKINHSADSIYIEKLRSIAILMYRVLSLDLEKSLWNHYLKSGTGILISNESNLKVWPQDVQLMIIELVSSSRTNNNLDKIQLNDKYCYRFVYEHLRKFNEKQQQLKRQLIIKKKQFYGYRNTIEDHLQTFIKKYSKALRLEYKYEMKIIEFDYRARMLDHAFQQQNPTPEQMELTQHLFSQKYQHEELEQEVTWIKQSINHNKKLPVILRSVELALPSSLQPLMDMDLHEEFSRDHPQMTQKSKQEMIIILINTIDTKLHRSRLLLHNKLRKICQNQRVLPIDQQFNETMVDLIQRHLLTITEKMQYVYQFRKASMSLIL